MPKICSRCEKPKRKTPERPAYRWMKCCSDLGCEYVSAASLVFKIHRCQHDLRAGIFVGSQFKGNLSSPALERDIDLRAIERIVPVRCSPQESANVQIIQADSSYSDAPRAVG